MFNLYNRTGFNVTGEMHVNTTATGRQITITAIHSNRTVTLDADYDVLDQRFIQKSRLKLAPTIWFAYDLDIINKTEVRNTCMHAMLDNKTHICATLRVPDA